MLNLNTFNIINNPLILSNSIINKENSLTIMDKEKNRL